jgi:hypothetical protein
LDNRRRCSPTAKPSVENINIPENTGEWLAKTKKTLLYLGFKLETFGYQVGVATNLAMQFSKVEREYGKV